MDEVVLRRVVGVITLAIAAFLLSWLLPRPGLERLRGEGERVVTVDLTRPDATPQELPAPSEEPLAPPPPAPAPPEEVASTPPPPPTPEPVRVAETPKAPVPPKPVEAKPVESKPVETKPVEAKPVEAKPVEPKPVKPTPAVTPPSGSATGQVMVQAGAFSFLDKAEGVRERAGAQGQRCVISPAETPKGTLYRLRCGPYADKVQAQAAVKTLTAAGIAAQIVGGGR